MKFNIIIAVWGEAYLASLCEITLPSLVPGPGDADRRDDQWKFVIYTRSHEQALVRTHIERLFPFAQIVLFDIRPESFSNHYLAMANAHHLAARLSIEDGARGIIVPPDAIFSSGTLATIASVAKAGKRALMIVGPRLRAHTAIEPLKALLASDPQVPPRKLAALALDHLHPEMRRYFWSSDDFSTRPFMCCWDAKDGWLNRAFHLHPLMIDFSAESATTILEKDTIDGEFIGETIGIWDDIHVVQDSDEMLVFTLTPDDVFYSEKGGDAASVPLLRRTAYEDTIVNPLHRWFFTKAMKIHANDLDDDWRRLEEETGRLAFKILSTRDPAVETATPIQPLPEIDGAASPEPAETRRMLPAAQRPTLIERISRFLDIRIVRPGLPNRIGHLVLDFESYIKQRHLQGKTRRPIYILDDRTPCNRCILDYWRTYIRVVEGPLATRLVRLTTYRPLVDNLEHRYAYTLEGGSECYPIEADWGDRPPLFELTRAHAARGEACLRDMGLPAGAWFVCVHVRGSGYSPADEFCHRYRNVSVESYGLAMEEIVRRGGWCIRVGDASMPPLEPMPQTIDYARSPFKSDWMDVFLCARCRFFLGSSSGLFLVSSAFGVPSALANMAPMGCAYSVFRKDISIPKLVAGPDGVPIPFPRVFASPVAEMRFADMFDAAGIINIENTPEEIAELVCEMLDRLDGTYTDTDGDRDRQATFRRLFQDHNYSFASSAKIGNAFLRQHADLLTDSVPRTS